MSTRASFPDWDEWRGLSEDQRQYSLFKILSSMHERHDKFCEACTEKRAECDLRLRKLENKKYTDTATAGISGAIAALLAQLGIKLPWGN